MVLLYRFGAREPWHGKGGGGYPHTVTKLSMHNISGVKRFLETTQEEAWSGGIISAGRDALSVFLL